MPELMPIMTNIGSPNQGHQQSKSSIITCNYRQCGINRTVCFSLGVKITGMEICHNKYRGWAGRVQLNGCLDLIVASSKSQSCDIAKKPKASTVFSTT